MSTVGWYVHHHGHGHRTRFEAVRPHLDADVVVFSSLAAPAQLPERTTWVVLPRDDDAPGGRDPRNADPTVRGMLHWAPLGHAGHRQRLARIAEASVQVPLDAFVVDVSVEVALFVRLLGVPTVVVAQPGVRTDATHALAYGAADRILAPWAEGLALSPALESVRERVARVGGVSRFADRARGEAGVARQVLLLGHVAEAPQVADARKALADGGWTVVAVGGDAGWRDDPWELLTGSAVVISAAGQNSIADLAAANARAVVVPQERPFDEQATTGRELDRLGLAVVAPEWPRADPLGAVERAVQGEPDWQRWQVPGAPQRAADVISSVLP